MPLRDTPVASRKHVLNVPLEHSRHNASNSGKDTTSVHGNVGSVVGLRARICAVGLAARGLSTRSGTGSCLGCLGRAGLRRLSGARRSRRSSRGSGGELARVAAEDLLLAFVVN